MEEVNSNKLLIALVLAIIAYALKYYYDFGQWCSAMWAGTYPPIFIAVGTSLIYKFLTIPDRMDAVRRKKEAAEEAEYLRYTKDRSNQNGL